MVETPVPGFTGVVWEARPTDQLARDLSTGPGSVPMVESSAAWARLAASFGAAVADYDRIIAEIGDHWRSDASEAVLQRIGRMRDWLADAGTAAGNNALHAGGQAAAYEVARLAMPHVMEVAALEQAAQSIAMAGAALGAPLIGAAAQISADQDVAKTTAARVMRTYESATEPLAQPWSQTPPPKLMSASAAQSVQAAQQGDSASVAMASAGMPAMPAMPSPAALGPMPLGAARVETVGGVSEESELLASPVESANADVVTGQTMPAAAGSPMTGGTAAPMAGGTGAPMMSGTEDQVVRAGATTGRASDLGLEAGFDAAPPVLGAAETHRAAATVTARE